MAGTELRQNLEKAVALESSGKIPEESPRQKPKDQAEEKELMR